MIIKCNEKLSRKREEKIMKKSKRKLVVVALVFFSISLLAVSPAQAKAKKLKVNTVYTTAKKVKGTTKLKKAKVVAKIGKKTYKARSNSKGKFTIKIKKQKKGTKVKVIVYKGKKKYAKKTVKVKTIPWYQRKPFKGHNAAVAGAEGISNEKVFNQYDRTFLVYCKKGYYVKFTISGEELTIRTAGVAGHTTEKGKTVVNITVYSKNAVGNNKVKIRIYRNKDDKLVDNYIITPKKVKLPSKTAEIDYEQFLKDYDTVLKTGKEINKTIGNYVYAYRISKGNYGIDYAIGYPGEYFEGTANGVHVKMTAKNEATLYITVGAKASFNFPEPSLTNYDVILKSGQTKKWEGWDFKEGELIDNNLCLKMYAYKNNKLVGIRTIGCYLIQGYADWMFK